MKIKNILITGADGFISANTLPYGQILPQNHFLAHKIYAILANKTHYLLSLKWGNLYCQYRCSFKKESFS